MSRLLQAPTMDGIFAAKQAIQKLVRKTPLEFSSKLSQKTGGQVWLKMENLQVAGIAGILKMGKFSGNTVTVLTGRNIEFSRLQKILSQCQK